jgi:uncharacterized membrane protein
VTPSFHILGTLDGSSGTSTARAVSADGGTVVGQSTIAGGYDGYRWTSTAGMQALGIADPSSGTGAIDVSENGQTILARRAFAPLIVGPGGASALPPITGITDASLGANALSADGATAVGFASWSDANTANHLDAFRWTNDGGTTLLSGQPAGYLSSLAYAASGDGPTIVGSFKTTASGDIPMRWTAADGMQPLPLPSGFNQGVAVALSGDAHMILGDALGDINGNGTDDEYQPVKWLEEPRGRTWSVSRLDDFSGGPLFEIPRAASADGSIIVGRSAASGNPELPAGTDDHAVFWDQAGELHLLQDTLANLGVQTDGWTLRSATDISSDGSVIVGDATDSLGHQQAFIAIVPEPSALSVCTLALFALHRRRRSYHPM